MEAVDTGERLTLVRSLKTLRATVVRKGRDGKRGKKAEGLLDALQLGARG